MSGPRSSNGGSLEALLESGRTLPSQPDFVRARVLARAGISAASPPLLEPAPLPRARFPRHVLARPAAAMLAVGIAGSVYALSGGWRGPTGSDGGSSPSAALVAPPAPLASSARAPVSNEQQPALEAPAAVPEPSVAPGSGSAPARSRRAVNSEGSFNAELELMRSAHTAYAAQEYANALVLVGEHARRFPNGVLAEQREALRVSCLVGSGRTGEASRTATRFAKRFPRSVLLPKIRSETGTRPE